MKIPRKIVWNINIKNGTPVTKKKWLTPILGCMCVISEILPFIEDTKAQGVSHAVSILLKK